MVTVHAFQLSVRLKNRGVKSISKTLESLDRVHHFGRFNSFLLILILLLLPSGLRARKKGCNDEQSQSLHSLLEKWQLLNKFGGVNRGIRLFLSGTLSKGMNTSFWQWLILGGVS